MKRTGVLLINLGTPDDPSPKSVGKFLRQFLMDGFVLDVPFALRWFLVNVAIVPRRQKKSAALYQKIHTAQGSPLLFHTRELTRALAERLASKSDEHIVDFGMRYGSPSIGSALARLCSANVERVVVLPLYPQYAASSFETAVVETRKRATELGCASKLIFLPPFYAEPRFINASAHRIEDQLGDSQPDHIVFSFHGVPVRHIKKLDHSQQHCLVKADCCDAIGLMNENCYRAQCFATARAIARRLELSDDSYTVAFQSRFGRTEWVGPATEDVLRNLARKGIKRVAVSCPSFVADCLETLEEIAMRGRDVFVQARGDELKLVPSLNADPVWVKALADWVVESDNQSA